ncbi:MAG: GGDEF domain-containing protein [Pseudodesulfovibrio sp.]|nr:GGDEF domain-containing protein [Pseudomonadota bacterium]MBV1764352.1 GGDEF domain-containing protein [Pseudodesulfovibrio sp.]MBU4515069.1 GGDEF domain-containing protein [Pseudomonadota bacterium]MBU4520974.1 GGDEF domain-containing protein [Pseudomonadota bacterium]MBU4559180.1 GGDEF domain-containing protein [Pseudomonadota bacterium]
MNYDLSGFSKTGNHHPAQCGFTLVLIAIKDYFILNEMYGQGFIQQLEHELKEAIASTAHENNDCRHMEAISVGPGQVSFIVPRTNAPADIAYEYKLKAQNGLKRTMFNHTGIGIDLGMGFATLEVGSSMPDATGSLGDGDDPIRFESALDEARRILRTPLDMQGLSIANTYNDILAKSLISTHYQPILDFKSGSILGWEALSRGPEGSSFRSPVILFETAEQFGRLFALERLCRESAIRNAGPLRKGQKLFLNIHPKTMADPEFTPGKTLELMEQAGLVPDDIVFEITERHSVQDFDLFYRTLDHYRSQGFCVAVDDAGAGYAGLTLIAQLQPEYIKLDKLLIDKIHKDPVKRALVETTVTFADKIGSRIIAEGIETKAQTLCLKDIGVHCGQGYFLARPAFPKPELTKECLDIQSVSDISARNITCSLPIGDLAHPPHSVPADYLVADAQEFFKNNSRFSSIIVTDDDIPRGLVMEYHLNRQLSSQYGIALYYRRPIEAVMDATPLTVELDTPVEQAARQAMKREHLKAYDDIIITRKGRLYGIVSVQNLLNAMAKIQVEMAKGTNPLTGLPGNVAIEKEVESRIAQKRKFSIIYADLDNFKVYNDTYGFKNGDGVLKLAADIMSWAARKHAGQEAQVCHIGGDDFVLITAPEPVEKICRSIHRCFGRLINRCYCPEDRARGWIKARGRDGQERNYPLVSISLGVIEICGQCSLMEIGERAAHVKKFAKSRPGNSVAMDRRPPLGSEEAKR